MSEAQNGGKKMERLTIPDVRVDEHTTRRTMIDARAVREHAMDFYWRLKAYEDTGLESEEVPTLVKDWSDLWDAQKTRTMRHLEHLASLYSSPARRRRKRWRR